MKIAFALLAAFTILPPATHATKLGDTDQQLLHEKGEPQSRIQAQDTEVWIYRDMSIDLRAHRVAAMEAIHLSKTFPTPVAVAPAEAAAGDPLAAKKAEYQAAITKAREIINQPVQPVPRTASMRPATYEYWFHPGATVPDFDHVDIRQTQKFSYDAFPYVFSTQRPELVFRGPELEFNSMTKILYSDRSVPKKKLTEDEMIEVNRLYRTIGRLRRELGIQPPPAS